MLSKKKFDSQICCAPSPCTVAMRGRIHLHIFMCRCLPHLCSSQHILYSCAWCQVGFVETKRKQRIAVVMFQRPTATITLLYRYAHGHTCIIIYIYMYICVMRTEECM